MNQRHILLAQDQPIGLYPARDKCISEACTRLDDDPAATPRDRINGKGNPRGVSVNLLLHDHGHLHVTVIDAVSLPVVVRTLGPQRSPAFPHCIETAFQRCDIQKRIVLSSKRMSGQVLGRCRRSYGDVLVDKSLVVIR